MAARRTPIVIWIALLVLAVLCAVLFSAHFMKQRVKFPRPQFQKGMTYATWTTDALGSAFSDASLARLAATGTEWVAFVPTWYQRHYNSTEIAPSDKSPTDTSLVHAIQQAHQRGLRVMLKPHVDLSEGAGINWRGEIDFRDEAGWRRWFESYTQFLLHYATMAQEHRVELLCVGTELTVPAVWHEAQWRDLITRIRAIYDGPLTYAANWNEEYTLIKFWDALDYVGLDPYFPLSEADRPTLAQLKEAWQAHLAEIEPWQQTINKPVLFTEIGYKSIVGAARRPLEDATGAVDVALQRDCYQALLETFWDRPWFSGVYWWYWGTHEKMGGANHRGFSPQNKPAEMLVTQWYGTRR